MIWFIIAFIIFLILTNIFGRPKQMVVFGGPDDEETCPDCHKALNGGPYPIDKAPIPGKLGCGDKCRHALQIITPQEAIQAASKRKLNNVSGMKKCNYCKEEIKDDATICKHCRKKVVSSLEMNMWELTKACFQFGFALLIIWFLIMLLIGIFSAFTSGK